MSNEMIGIVVIILLQGIALLRVIAPKTETKVDDRIVSGHDAFTGFLMSYGPVVHSVVEELARTSKIEKLQKLDTFLGRLEEIWRNQTGKALTSGQIATAKEVATAISADKPHEASK